MIIISHDVETGPTWEPRDAIETALKMIQKTAENDEPEWVIALLNALAFIRLYYMAAITLERVPSENLNLMDKDSIRLIIEELAVHKNADLRNMFGDIINECAVKAVEQGGVDNGFFKQLMDGDFINELYLALKR